jgi:hypothetical protein
VSYEGLSNAQRALFVSFVNQTSPAQADEQRDPSFYAEFWVSNLSAFERTTFAAVTHALEMTKLGNGQTGLSQVQGVTEISGGQLGVTWKAGAEKAFRSAGFESRASGKHPGERGLSPGGGMWRGTVTGLHLLFNEKNPGVGHVHVDYRGLGKASKTLQHRCPSNRAREKSNLALPRQAHKQL